MFLLIFENFWIWSEEKNLKCEILHIPYLDDTLTVVNVLGALEEPGNVMLQHRESLVEVLEYPHHRVVLLHILHRLPHGNLCVKSAEI